MSVGSGVGRGIRATYSTRAPAHPAPRRTGRSHRRRRGSRFGTSGNPRMTRRLTAFHGKGTSVARLCAASASPRNHAIRRQSLQAAERGGRVHRLSATARQLFEIRLKCPSMRLGGCLQGFFGVLVLGCGGSVDDTAASEHADGGGSAGSPSSLRDGGSTTGGSTSGEGSGVFSEDDGGRCGTGLTRCGDECVDRLTDVDHCGTCSFRCYGGQRCATGECDWGTGLNPGPCLPNEVDCPTLGCVDLESNPFACGRCGTTCGRGDICLGGACLPPECVAPETYCAGYGCVDLGSNQDNCGACGLYCGPFEQCQNGRCEPPACAPNERYCYSSGCVELSSSPANCGSCDAQCPSHYECVTARTSRAFRPSSEGPWSGIRGSAQFRCRS